MPTQILLGIKQKVNLSQIPHCVLIWNSLENMLLLHLMAHKAVVFLALSNLHQTCIENAFLIQTKLKVAIIIVIAVTNVTMDFTLETS